jgi:hypothetical protein
VREATMAGSSMQFDSLTFTGLDILEDDFWQAISSRKPLQTVVDSKPKTKPELIFLTNRQYEWSEEESDLLVQMGLKQFVQEIAWRGIILTEILHNLEKDGITTALGQTYFHLAPTNNKDLY